MNESQRLAALLGLDILDTPPEERFDRITRLAQRFFKVPITLISLVDAHRQWFKSRQGLSASETPLEMSFCAHAIKQSDPLVVPDARSDARFSDNPLVTGDPNIRFYAGCPLSAPDGSRVGTLCLIDQKPRKLTAEELIVLQELGAMAQDELNSLSVLRQSERRFRAMFEEGPVAMDLVDVHTLRFAHVNNAFSRLLGYSREELEQMTIRDIMSPEDMKRDEEMIRVLMEGKRSDFQVEVHHRRKDGRPIWARVFVSLLRNDQGEPRFLLAMTEDITEQRQAEAAMIQSEKMAALGQFSAGVAHDINNPIAVILGFSQTLLGDRSESDPLTMPLKSMEREALRCKTLVQNLLAFSRGGSRQTVMQSEDLNQVIEGALVLVATLARSKQVELIRPPLREIPRVSVDANQMQQVVINLCTNAIDAMPKGGKLTVGLEHRGDHAEISVHDTGVGISPEVRERMFEAFFTTKEVGKGTGLGLSIISRIVKAHEGTIDVQSDVGHGTTFTVRLPIAAPAATKSLRPLPSGSKI